MEPTPQTRIFPGRALLCLVLAALVLAGCVTQGGKRRALKVIMESKASSLGDWAELEIDGDSSVHLFRSKTAMLVRADDLKIKSGAGEDGTVMARFEFGLSADGKSGFGSAVPITGDGYYLTAGHCVTGADGGSGLTSLVALVDRERGKFEKAPFRVVWQSPDQDALDLALIHSPVRCWQAFEFAPVRTLVEELPVAAVGWSGVFDGQALPAAAGSIRELSPVFGQRPGVLWRGVMHDVPLNQGDSGGPLLDRQGRLVAINYLLITRTDPLIKLFPGSNKRLMADYRGYAIAPDPGWILELIAADRRRS